MPAKIQHMLDVSLYHDDWSHHTFEKKYRDMADTFARVPNPSSSALFWQQIKSNAMRGAYMGAKANFLVRAFAGEGLPLISQSGIPLFERSNPFYTKNNSLFCAAASIARFFKPNYHIHYDVLSEERFERTAGLINYLLIFRLPSLIDVSLVTFALVGICCGLLCFSHENTVDIDSMHDALDPLKKYVGLGVSWGILVSKIHFFFSAYMLSYLAGWFGLATQVVCCTLGATLGAAWGLSSGVFYGYVPA